MTIYGILRSLLIAAGVWSFVAPAPVWAQVILMTGAINLVISAINERY